ncbi:hypothetical protein LCGC14_0310830 [marine sediment metagenome]|uniref:N-acetylmuramoyl-L-alanine amidase n=1 Tax=marine sediment metagenome TaxID=412755 RepID=A0A0F9TMC6_9ZZZZ
MKTPPELSFPTVNFIQFHNANRNIFIHSTRSGRDWPAIMDFEPTIQWFQGDSGLSSHLVIGGRIARMVDDDDSAIHAGGANNLKSLAIEIVQPKIDTPFIPASLDLAAWSCAVWCLKYGIPPVRIFSQTEVGIIGHEDSEQGRSSGKSDPGPLFPWNMFIKRVKTLMLFGSLEPHILKGDYLKILGILRYVGVEV